jgi:hypothetical protein
MNLIEWIQLISGGFFIGWIVPLGIQSISISLGNSKRILFIDEQLAKDVNKVYEKPFHMTFFAIGGRFNRYCVAYPFICHRMTTTSKGFRTLMTLNSACFYCFFVFWLSVIVEYLI